MKRMPEWLITFLMCMVGLVCLCIAGFNAAQEPVESRKHDRKHSEPYQPTPAPPKPHADDFDPMPDVEPVEKRPRHVEPKPDPEFRDVKPDRHPDKHDTKPHDVPPVIQPRTWWGWLLEIGGTMLAGLLVGVLVGVILIDRFIFWAARR